MKSSKTVLDRVFKYIVVKTGGHWVWTGTKESSGKPKVYVGVDEKKNPLYRSPIRILWEDAQMGKLEESDYLRPLCGSGKCVNPRHFEKTSAPNNSLSKKKQEQVRRYYSMGASIALLARQFRVSRKSICAIIEDLRGVKNVDPKSD